MRMQLALADDDNDDVEIFLDAVKIIAPEVEVTVSQNGRELISKLPDGKPDIIFLDINMPQMNGWQCLKLLKSSAAWKDIPVVMYTTSTSVRDVEIAMDMGARKLITKPDRFDDLLKALSAIFSEMNEVED